jgi:hypothetical protein
MSTTTTHGAPTGAPRLFKETRYDQKTPRPKPAQPPKAKTYIVFGADEYAKPRAARFSADDPELLATAVETMHLRMAEVTTDELAEIATKLPAGRLHANGRGLVPYIRGDLYLELVLETAGDEEAPASPDPTAQDLLLDLHHRP